MRRLALAAALLASLAPVPSARADCLTPAGAGEVVRLTETLTAELTDGRRVRLADVVPAEPPGALAGPVEVLAAVPEADRYGRVVGDLVRKDTGASVRDELVASGLAFVDPTVMSEQCLQALFAVERSAEAARRGAWAEHPVIDADRAARAADAGRFVIVTGLVKSIGETTQTIYLNFGDRYRTDFTVIVRKGDAQGWGDAAKALQGRRIRVRGLLEAWNGGLIRVEHPAQIDALEALSPSR